MVDNPLSIIGIFWYLLLIWYLWDNGSLAKSSSDRIEVRKAHGLKRMQLFFALVIIGIILFGQALIINRKSRLIEVQREHIDLLKQVNDRQRKKMQDQQRRNFHIDKRTTYGEAEFRRTFY